MNGTMIRKIRSNWLPIVLTIAILVSLGLSFLIWTNPSRFGKEHDSSSSSSTSQLTSKTIADTFLPNQVVRNGKTGGQSLLYAKKSNLSSTVQAQVEKMAFGHITKISNGDDQRFLAVLNQKDALVLNYPSSITTSIFNETFKQSVNQKKISEIDQIVIPTNGSHEVYLLKDGSLTVYRVRIKGKPDYDKIKQVAKKSTERIKVDEQLLNKRVIIAFPKKTSVPVYSYMMTKTSDSSFTNALLDTSSSSSVSVHKKGSVTTYTDGSDKRMTINSKNGKATYENFLSRTDQVAENQFLTKSFKQLSKIGISLENIRYDEMSTKNLEVTYRTYVEDFPIYNDRGYGTVNFKYSKSGKQTYHFSLYSLEVPIPNNSKQSIPSTEDVLSSLNNAGIKTADIQDMRIEYEWGNSRKSNSVINLKPAYYVKYQGKWSNYETLINNK